MDLVKLLQSLEGAVYEIVSWVMLLPKTLIAVTFKPRWAITYINEEWQKKPEERFDGYLSPALLWLFVIAVPNIFLLDVVGQIAGIIGELNPAIGTQINSLEGENRIILGLLFTLLLPIAYLIWIEWIDKKLILKSTLRREFFIQCYAQTATQIPIFILAFLFAFLQNIFLLSLLSIMFFFILIFYESLVIQNELEFGPLKSVFHATIPVILYFVFLMIIGVIFALGGAV